MISHALTIVVNELNKHLSDEYDVLGDAVGLGNIAEGLAKSSNGSTSEGVPREMLILSMVNIKEEKSLKNLPNQTVDNTGLRVIYENPPVFLNAQILISATHSNYAGALLMLSRAIRFFQFKKVFTQDNVFPASISTGQPLKALDQLETFKLIFDLYSPSMEEVNHMWGTLGGKQYPFAMYVMRMLSLQFNGSQSEGSLVSEVFRDFYHKTSVAN